MFFYFTVILRKLTIIKPCAHATKSSDKTKKLYHVVIQRYLLFLMVNSCHVVILLFIRISLTSAKYSKDDKLVLDAVDLIDLIRKEEVSYKHKRSGYDSEAEEESARPLQESSFRGGKSNLASPIIQDPRKQRKVWSKWSKWSACSVTCGTGATMRQRRCAAGRCAAGEREVQIRPCTRPPCNFMPPDDSHDWDS